MILEVTDGDFDESIGYGVTLVDFWAPWCGPCRALLPVMDEISEEMSGNMVKILKYNIDDNVEVRTRYAIVSVPSLLLFRDGKLLAQRIGIASKKIIQDWIKEYGGVKL